MTINLQVRGQVGQPPLRGCDLSVTKSSYGAGLQLILDDGQVSAAILLTRVDFHKLALLMGYLPKKEVA